MMHPIDTKKISKIVCVGRNFVKHIEELNNEFPTEMVLFQKSASTATQTLVKPQESCRFEGEISLLIKDSKVSAVGAGLDLTLDEKQNALKAKGLPWERSKSFKNSAVFTDFVVFDGDLQSLVLELYLNNNLQQRALPEKMIYSFETILKQVDNVFGLEDGDIIMSGTPEGVSHFEVNDSVRLVLKDKDQVLIDETFKAVTL